jgi:hypothetical protein
MATFIHGKSTVLKIATKDISVATKSSTIEQSADMHDVSGYGLTAHAKQGGLLDGKFTANGTYDSTASTGTKPALQAQLGTIVAIVRQPEGLGTGKAQDTFNAVVTKYTETDPCDDMITWAAEFEITGPVTSTPQ